ncbi:MAG: CIA30 family protein [Filomicrobium sp.]
MAAPSNNIIDDLSRSPSSASNGAEWQFVADGVMGGVSKGWMAYENVQGRIALRMQGDVSLENNGGFIQVALDLAPDGSTVDGTEFNGIEIDTVGNSRSYNLHLRTADVTRPWQSYRQSFKAGQSWQTHRLPFADFRGYRISQPLNLRRLRRIGILAIGEAFDADIAIGGIRFYR